MTLHSSRRSDFCQCQWTFCSIYCNHDGVIALDIELSTTVPCNLHTVIESKLGQVYRAVIDDHVHASRNRAPREAGPPIHCARRPKLNGTARTMLALRRATALGNVRIQCGRFLTSPHPLAPARAYWQRAAVRPGPSYRRPRAEWSTSGPHPCLPLRSVAPHPCRLFRHLAAQDAKSSPQSSTTTAAAAGVKESPQPTPTSKTTISNAEQRRRDWSIVRRLLVHIWPKDDWATRGRVVLGVGLLICGKVRPLSLPLPIFARSSLNICLLLAASERASTSFFQTSHRHP